MGPLRHRPLLLLLTTLAAIEFVIIILNFRLGPSAEAEALRARNKAKVALKFQRELETYQKLQQKNSQVVTLIRDNKNESTGSKTTEEEYECVAWHYDATPSRACSITNTPKSWIIGLFERRQYTCDVYLPRSPGYCEIKSKKTGRVLNVVRKSCQRQILDGEAPLPPYFTCRMAVAFSNYKFHALNFRPQPELSFPNNNTANVDGNRSTGIIIQAFDDVLLSVYAILKLLRVDYNCHLPIELWCMEGELDPNHPVLKQILAMYDKRDVNIRVIRNPNVQSYQSKPYSIAYSHFEEILFLDSDNFPLRDPTYLFDTPEYQNTGAMFWKDFWSPSRQEFYIRQDSLLWELLGIPLDSEIITDFEMESGQLVIHRKKCQDALRILLYFSQTFQEWFEPLALVLGDKDLFRLAWHLSQTPYYYHQQRPPGVLGLVETSWWHKWRYDYFFCGLTMVQYDAKGQPTFLHRNAVKLTEQDVGLTPIWEMGAHFVGDIEGNHDGGALEYRVGHSFASHHVLGRMCYYPHPLHAKYFQYEDYRGKTGDGNRSSNPVKILEERILRYAQEASEFR